MSNRTALVVAALVVALSAAALTGCTAAEGPQAVDTPAAVEPVSTPTATPTPTPTPTADAGGCDQRTKLGFLTGGDESGHWVYWTGPELVDRGPVESARGTVAKDGDGRIVPYTVADGDGDYAISDRLCIELRSFMTYNDAGPVLRPGDVLMLTVAPSDLFEVE